MRGIAGRVLDMEFTVRPKDKGDVDAKFEMRFAKSDEYFTRIERKSDETIPYRANGRKQNN